MTDKLCTFEEFKKVKDIFTVGQYLYDLRTRCFHEFIDQLLFFFVKICGDQLNKQKRSLHSVNFTSVI